MRVHDDSRDATLQHKTDYMYLALHRLIRKNSGNKNFLIIFFYIIWKKY